MAGRKSDFTLPTLDDLFSTQELRDDAKLSKIRDIPLELMEQTLIRFFCHSSVVTFSGTHSQQGYVSREQTSNSFRASWDTLMYRRR